MIRKAAFKPCNHWTNDTKITTQHTCPSIFSIGGMINTTTAIQAARALRMTGFHLDQVELAGIHRKLCGRFIVLLAGCLWSVWTEESDTSVFFSMSLAGRSFLSSFDCPCEGWFVSGSIVEFDLLNIWGGSVCMRTWGRDGGMLARVADQARDHINYLTLLRLFDDHTYLVWNTTNLISNFIPKKSKRSHI